MQPTIIAHYAVARILLLVMCWCLLLAFCFWSLLHPESWPYPKTPGQVALEQIIYLPIFGMGVLFVAVPLGFWLVRGRGTVICLRGDTLYFPGWKIRLDELTDVRPGIYERRRYSQLKMIELHKRDGSSAWIGAWLLKEDRDMVVARLKEALAQHLGGA